MCRAALSTHPLVSFLARQLVADMVAVMGASDFTAQQLSLLHKLLGLSTAAAAVPGASWETKHGVEGALDLLAAVLQVKSGTESNIGNLRAVNRMQTCAARAYEQKGLHTSPSAALVFCCYQALSKLQC